MAEQQQPPDPTLEQLSADELAVWSHASPAGTRRPALKPLTAAEQAEFAPFAAMLERAKAAGFRGRHAVVDSRHRSVDHSELKMFREHGGVIEVIVIRSERWAQAFRCPAGASLLERPVELEGTPGWVLDRVLAGEWPEADR